MTALGKLFRTTAFKLAVIYSIVFAMAASIVVFNVGRNVRVVLEDQIAETIDADIRGLSDQYAQGGVQQVVQSIERRIKQPGGDIYLLTTFAGDPIVGNVAALPTGTFEQQSLIETSTSVPAKARRDIMRSPACSFFQAIIGCSSATTSKNSKISGSSCDTLLPHRWAGSC